MMRRFRLFTRRELIVAGAVACVFWFAVGFHWLGLVSGFVVGLLWARFLRAQIRTWQLRLPWGLWK